MLKRNGKKALLLVNMGGPSAESEIKPYLQRIFHDPAILPLPGILRQLLGGLIIRRRLPAVTERYRLLGGSSPLPQLTAAQARVMEQQSGAVETSFEKISFAFRYSEPSIEKAMTSLAEAGIKEVVLLPLFPHYTAAMSGSIELEAKRVATDLKLQLITMSPWGDDSHLLDLQEAYLQATLATSETPVRVLFVAHGVPVRNLRDGDPYVRQVTATARALGERLPEDMPWSLAYQSRLGPVKWTGPQLEEEIKRVAQPDLSLVIMPISFVADCLETVYDLDMIAVSQGEQAGFKKVLRVPVFNADPDFCRLLLQIATEVEHVS